MELTRMWEIIRRRKWVILQALIVVTLVALVGSYLITPSYQASSKILIKQAKKGGLDLASSALSRLSSIITASPTVDVNKVLAASRPYMENVIFNLQLRNEDGNLIDANKLTQGGGISTIKDRLFPEPRINVNQYQQTDILEIAASSAFPQEAMMMANTLAEIMVNQNHNQVRAEYRSARLFLEEQMSKMKEGFNTALRKIADFKKQEKTLDLGIETKLAAEKMGELLKEKEDNVIDLAQARAKLRRLREQLSKESTEFLSASALKENPHIEVLKKRITELRLQLTEATSGLTERHPHVLSLRQQINMAESELKKEIGVYRSSAPELATLERQIASLEAHLDGVNADIDKYFKEFQSLPEKVYKQAGLDMELNVTQQSYSSLLDALYQIGMAEASTLSEIRVVEPAVKPLFPVSPNKALNGVLGVFVGLIFGLGLAFVLEYLDDTIRTAEDMKEFRPIALMGAVPALKTKKVPLISGCDPNDPVCEAYRSIRNFLTMDGRPMRSLLITSPGPGEGKTTTMVNLGISVASEGKKVAIIDADLRRASLHTYFDLPNDLGMTDILQGKASLDQAIQSTPITGLSIIPSGPSVPDPGSLLESDQMGRFISELRTRFDIMFLDTAPVLVKNDALVMAKYVDGSVVVLESKRTTRRAVHEVLDVMARADIKPLGFVVNKFSVQKGKYFYHHYYYGHYGRGIPAREGSL